ncbi:MAG TPA: ribose-phosphate pyrophosphokinase [Bacteroidia bacterium]|jgi:ribose-phosphate pyrophosphokinase|nr:ribose-phosphate pyrophosphokinase [Bacteroidia bacterium]
MDKIVFALPGNEKLAESIIAGLTCEKGHYQYHRFPDEESYIKLESNVNGKDVVIICTLDRPDNKFLPLYFLSEIIRDAGADKITLLSPYLAYMRQDKKFNPGECITSGHFANLISSFMDEIITIDPHLHRISSLDSIYAIPTRVIHSTPFISKWIKENIKNPLLIGPDMESKQWVSQVAKDAGAPYTVLLKSRFGDKKVKVSIPHIHKYLENYTPVIVDDIISTAATMINTVEHLKEQGAKPAVCIGIHAVFSGNAYSELKRSGVEKIVTCNTILHETNGIMLDSAILEQIQ